MVPVNISGPRGRDAPYTVTRVLYLRVRKQPGGRFHRGREAGRVDSAHENAWWRGGPGGHPAGAPPDGVTVQPTVTFEPAVLPDTKDHASLGLNMMNKVD